MSENKEEVDSKAIELAKRIQKGELMVIDDPLKMDRKDAAKVAMTTGVGVAKAGETLGKAIVGEASYEEVMNAGAFMLNFLFGFGRAYRESRAKRVLEMKRQLEAKRSIPMTETAPNSYEAEVQRLRKELEEERKKRKELEEKIASTK